MTTLVTGASGFIGGELTRKLAAAGERVRVLARQTSDLSALESLDLEVVRGDLSNAAALADAVAGAAVIFHCAALAADWGSWGNFKRSNVIGVHNLLTAAERAGVVERFVHVSSTDVYGYPKQVGNESSQMKDVGYPYNRSKILGEQQVHGWHDRTGLPTTVVRPATVFGERSPTFTVELARRLLAGQLPIIAGGRSHAGLIYVGDLLDAMLAAATEPEAVGQVYNLRDPVDLTWREAIQALAVGLGVAWAPRNIPGPAAVAAAHLMEAVYKALRKQDRPLLTRHLVATMTRDQGYPIGKAQRELGFAPRVGLEAGLERSIDWLLSPEGQAALAAHH